jgi:hypothetical protein
MSRPNYVCVACSEHFTRRFSANRHNSNMHKGGAEIVSYMDYMAGRNSGRYQASHPSLYHKDRGYQGIRRHWNNMESHAVADTSSSFKPENVQPSLPSYTSSYTMTLVQQTQKLEEFIKLAEKVNTPQTAHKLIEYAKMTIKEGDYRFLNEKLEQLRMADKMLKKANFLGDY